MAVRHRNQAVQLQVEPLAGSSQGDRTLYLWTKRLLDIGLSAVALVLLSPLLCVIAALIVLDSEGPPIFSQERMGYDWRRRKLKGFKMHKFRSMLHNCDQSLHQQQVKDWARGAVAEGEKGSEVKLARDPRVTRVGHFLRRTSMDELPQLWNVLTGEMSLAGPRPVPLYEVVEYQPWHRKRLEAVPGITCLWQIKGRGQVGLDEMVNLDLEYMRRSSILLDLKILLLTIPVVLTGRGAA